MSAIDHDSRVTIDYLRARPLGAVVRWASDHVDPERPWATGWVDVRIPDGGPPDMAWVWTILDPEDPEQGARERLWQFPWPYDLEIHWVFDPERKWYVQELPLPVGEAPPASVVVSHERLALQVEGKDRGADASPRSAYSVRGGWSARTICDALSNWAARHARRDDLRFEWAREAGPSSTLELVEDRAAAGGPTWDLGDGLEVADGVMDDLLALEPAKAARMTTILREAANRFRGDAA